MSYRSTRLTPYHLLTPSAVGSPEEERRCDRFVLCESQEVAALAFPVVRPFHRRVKSLAGSPPT